MSAGESVSSSPIAAPAPAAALARRDRTLLWGGFTLFVLALAVSIAIWGLPWSRDRLALWVLAGLLATSLGDLRGWARGIVVDWAPLFGLLFAYDLMRGYADGVLDRAWVLPQMRVDELLFGGTAPSVTLQNHFWNPGQPQWYDFAAWIVYTSHFFVTLIVAAVLWRIARPQFRDFAARYVALTALGFATYVAVPAVPPWLASWQGYLDATHRIVPIMWRYVGVEPAAMLFEGGNQYANDVAALPSLHAAYPLLLACFFWRSTGLRMRVFLLSYTLVMALALVYGAEHYVSDILLGWLYVALVQGLWAWAAHRRRRAL